MANNYVDKERLLADMLEYEKLRNDSDTPDDIKASDYVYECIVAISKNHLKSADFHTQNVDENDLVSQSMMNCLKGVKNFNSEKSKNAFAYFSQIAYYAYLAVLIKEQKLYKDMCKLVQNNAFGVLDTIADVTGAGEANSTQVDETINKIQVFMSQDLTENKDTKRKPRMPLYLQKRKDEELAALGDIDDLDECEISNEPESITERVVNSKRK